MVGTLYAKALPHSSGKALFVNRDRCTPIQCLADRDSGCHGKDDGGQNSERNPDNGSEAIPDGVFTIECPGNDPWLARIQPRRLIFQRHRVAYDELPRIVSEPFIGICAIRWHLTFAVCRFAQPLQVGF